MIRSRNALISFATHPFQIRSIDTALTAPTPIPIPTPIPVPIPIPIPPVCSPKYDLVCIEELVVVVVMVGGRIDGPV